MGIILCPTSHVWKTRKLKNISKEIILLPTEREVESQRQKNKETGSQRYALK